MTERLLAATRKGLFDIQRSAGQWTIQGRHFLGEAVSMVLRSPRDRRLYAALSLGHFGSKLHRSDDDGASWQEIEAPSYAGIGGDKPPSLELIWSLEVDTAGTLWAGTIPGGLFKSDDRGQSWTLIRSLWDQPSRAEWFGGGYDQPGIHSICIDPRDDKRIALAVSCGGVWLSEDGGETWRASTQGMWADYLPPEQKENPAIQDPHRLVQCPGQPGQFWVQHHNGIFRSTDGCASWREVPAEPSSFGFPVAVHPRDGDTAWFVPAIKDEKRYPVDAKLVVNRTTDGGKTFTALTRGLPEVESYDLVYRHGLDVDPSGEKLAVASTSGGLWLSENGGEDWQSLRARLPPVYALRFT